MSVTRVLLVALLAGVVGGGLHYYLWLRLVKAAQLPAAWHTGLTVLFAFFGVLMLSGFFFARGAPRSLASPVMWIAYSWLGLVFMLFFLVLAGDVARLGGHIAGSLVGRDAPQDPARRLFFSRALAGGAALLGVGGAVAGIASVVSGVLTKRVTIPLAKLPASAHGYKIVQISDVHVGPTIGKAFIEDIVRQINGLDADVVAITGDLVDGSVERLKEHVAPLANIKAKDGVYFVTGNHEYYSGADAWIAHLRTLGIRVLRNERVELARGFDLGGVDDFSAHGFEGHGPDLARAMKGRDETRPFVLLAHQPRAIDDAHDHGVDLQLSGHTHGGQIVPWGFFVRMQQKYVAGLFEHGAPHTSHKTKLYVSSGTGYWGPPMRVGAPAEVTEITLVRPGVA